MKTPKLVIAVCLLAGVLAFAPNSQAVPTLLDSISHTEFKDYENGDKKGASDWLNTILNSTSFSESGAKDQGTPGSIDTSGFCYLVLHYGGKSDEAYELWDVKGLTTSFDTAKSGDQGGLSWAYGFGECKNVPDAGATMVLFGAGLLGVGALRRRLDK